MTRKAECDLQAGVVLHLPASVLYGSADTQTTQEPLRPSSVRSKHGRARPEAQTSRAHDAGETEGRDTGTPDAESGARAMEAGLDRVRGKPR